MILRKISFPREAQHDDRGGEVEMALGVRLAPFGVPAPLADVVRPRVGALDRPPPPDPGRDAQVLTTLTGTP